MTAPPFEDTEAIDAPSFEETEPVDEQTIRQAHLVNAMHQFIGLDSPGGMLGRAMGAQSRQPVDDWEPSPDAQEAAAGRDLLRGSLIPKITPGNLTDRFPYLPNVSWSDQTPYDNPHSTFDAISNALGNTVRPLVTPENIGIGAATGGLGELGMAGRLAQTGIGSYFAHEMVNQGIDKAKEAASEQDLYRRMQAALESGGALAGAGLIGAHEGMRPGRASVASPIEAKETIAPIPETSNLAPEEAPAPQPAVPEPIPAAPEPELPAVDTAPKFEDTEPVEAPLFEETEPVNDLTPETIQAAHAQIVQQTGFPAVRISALAKELGITDAQAPKLGKMLLEMRQRGEADLPSGDHSLVAPDAKKWSVEVPGNGFKSTMVELRDAPKPLPAWTHPERVTKGAPPEPSNDWTEATADEPTQNPGRTLGIVPPGVAQMQQAATAASGFIGKLARSIRNPADFTPLRETLLRWSSRQQRSFGEIRRAQTVLDSAFKGSVDGSAGSLWMEAGGDRAKLAQWAGAAKTTDIRNAAKRALGLNPEQVGVLQKAQQTFRIMQSRGQRFDVIQGDTPHYVPHIMESGGTIKPTEYRGPGGRVLRDKTQFSKERVFPTFFDADQAGYKAKTTDIRKLLPTYLHSVNEAISGKLLVKELSERNATDGRPLVMPRPGMASVVEGPTGKAVLTFERAPETDYRDYRELPNAPALKDWNWTGKDTAGNPVFSKGDLLLHPDAEKFLKNAFGQSAIREWSRSESDTPLAEIPKVLVRGIDVGNQIAKQTLLGFLSPFHQVQEATHALQHKVNPFFNLPNPDPSINKGARFASEHGLMLFPDRATQAQYLEGHGTNRNLLVNALRLPGINEAGGKFVAHIADAYQDYLFHRYIPGLKLKTFEHMNERNLARYAPEIAAGKVNPDQVAHLSASQANAAFGHLNKMDLNSNPTVRHFFQLALLAPDFLEARMRFVSQAFRGKPGREQLVALAFGGAVMYATARVLNQLIDNNPHWDKPFEVLHNGRAYGIRTVQEDFYRAFTDTRRFINGRMSPLVRIEEEARTGLNYRGEKLENSEIAKDIVAGFLPINIRPFVNLTATDRNKPTSTLEQFLSATGVQIHRISPIQDAYKLVDAFKKKAGIPPDSGTYPTSRYLPLRYALEDGDHEKAQAAIKELLKTAPPEKVAAGMRASVFHNWVGKGQAEEKQFEQSLKGDDLKTYQAAVARRQLIFWRFMDELQSAGSSQKVDQMKQRLRGKKKFGNP